MAIRQRKGRKKPWEVYWNNPFTLKRESLCVETEEEAKKQDALKKYQLKYERDVFRREENETRREWTLESAYYLYLKDRCFGHKSLTCNLDAMKEALKELGGMLLSSITFERLQEFKAHLSCRKIKPVTVRGKLSVLRTVLRWCAHNGLFGPMPEFPELPPAAYEKFLPPTPDELSQLYAYAPPHIRRVIILGSQLGIRIGPCELLKLTWAEVDLERRLIHVPSAKKNLQEPWRDIPIRESLVNVFKEWHDEDMNKGLLHIITYRGKPIMSIQTAWEKTVKKAGLRNIRPYDLRHAFATEAIAAGVDYGTLAKLMGHTSPIMVLKHYQHVMDSQKRAAVEQLPAPDYVSKNMWQKKEGAVQ